MWTIETSTKWERDFKHYEKKHPRELAAVLRYHELLNAAKNPLAVQAGFLHPEPLGVVAIDQKGGGSGLQETRLYTFAQDDRQILWIITLGNKQSQPGDIRRAKEFVTHLPPDSPTTTHNGSDP